MKKRNKIQQVLSDVIEYINNISPEQLHTELMEAGLETYQDTKNVVSSQIDSPFKFIVWKGYVTGIKENGKYEVELIDMVELGTREQAVISDKNILGNPDVQLGSVFIWVVIAESEHKAQSIQFQKGGKPENPEVYEAIAKRATEIANRIKEKHNE